MSMPAPAVIQHTHCWICGKVNPHVEDKTCGPACNGEFLKQQRKRRNLMLMFYGAMAIAVVLLFVNGGR